MPGIEVLSDLERILVEKGGIKFGHFTLTSGKESDYYVDMKEVMTDPADLRKFSEYIGSLVKSEAVAGVELGAVPLIVAVSMVKSVPYIIVRKERSHGTKSLLIGKIRNGMHIDLIEDVVTTGNSVLKAVTLLRENGVVVDRCICVVDREEGGSQLLQENGVELVPVLKISSIRRSQSS